MVVVDSSVLVSFLRGEDTTGARRVADLEEHGAEYWIPMVCCQELLQGARDLREWRVLDTYLGSQNILVPQDSRAAHWNAARIWFDCRRRGITLRGSVDCLIAQLVLDADATLLHEDEDFERIRKVRPLRTWTGV